MKTLSKLPLLGLAFLAAASQAHADVTFHGYGQVVAGTVFSNNRTFSQYSEGYSYHADPTFTPNSNFALQATAPLSSNISATTQVLARGDDDFQPKFQWAYLKYQLNDTFAVKAGRMQTPFYQYSDYQFVGEAYPWVLLPESVYFSQVTHYDGVSLTAEKNVGDWFLFMQAIYGGVDAVIPTPVPTSNGTVVVNDYLHDHHLSGLTLDSSYNDWLNLRAAVFYESISLTGDGSQVNPISQIDGLINALNSLGLSDAAKALATSNDPALYAVFSTQINRNNWLLLAEAERLQSVAGGGGATVPQLVAEYVGLGYRFGKLLPMLTFGHRNQWARADKIKNSIPAADSAVLDPIIGGIASQPGLRVKDYYYEAGLRYDMTATVALKLSFTHYDSHWRTSDYPEVAVTDALAAAQAAANHQPAPGPTVNLQDANRLLAAVTFSF